MIKNIKRPKIQKKILSPSFFILFSVIILTLIGLLFVFEASSIRAFTEFGDSFYYLKLQMSWIGLGLIAMIFFSIFNYKYLYNLAAPFMGLVIFLLIIVLIPSIGQKIGGARRWIDLGIITIQPTEFAKFAIILYLSTWFTSKEKKRFLPFITLVGLLMFLIMLQPDMGTAIIIFSLSLTMYYLAGRELIYLLGLIPVSLIGIVILIVSAPYRLKRLTAFLNPLSDPQGVGYHINQILISLSQGGIFGRGFGASRQKYLFLPEAHTDSIFAIYGEEFGIVGALLLISLYLFFIYKIYSIYSKVDDRFGKLLIGGIFSFFGFQVITNLGGMVNLFPLTGVPLPFISYGGSHIIMSYMLMGIVINIAKQNKS